MASGGDNLLNRWVAVTRWWGEGEGANLRFTHDGKNGLPANAPAWVAGRLRSFIAGFYGKDGRTEEVGSIKMPWLEGREAQHLSVPIGLL